MKQQPAGKTHALELAKTWQRYTDAELIIRSDKSIARRYRGGVLTLTGSHDTWREVYQWIKNDIDNRLGIAERRYERAMRFIYGDAMDGFVTPRAPMLREALTVLAQRDGFNYAEIEDGYWIATNHIGELFLCCGCDDNDVKRQYLGA